MRCRPYPVAGLPQYRQTSARPPSPSRSPQQYEHRSKRGACDSSSIIPVGRLVTPPSAMSTRVRRSCLRTELPGVIAAPPSSVALFSVANVGRRGVWEAVPNGPPLTCLMHLRRMHQTAAGRLRLLTCSVQELSETGRGVRSKADLLQHSDAFPVSRPRAHDLLDVDVLQRQLVKVVRLPGFAADR